jgi:hypothetical protein
MKAASLPAGRVCLLFSAIGYEIFLYLEQFFIEREEWHDGFQFQLVNWDSIPNSAVFTAKAYLESGQLFLQETEQINFFD